MDTKNGLDFRYGKIKTYQNTGNNKYDYGRYGILNKCLPKVLFKANNILVTFVQLIDLRLVMMFKYIDKIKQFKWITWYE